MNQSHRREGRRALRLRASCFLFLSFCIACSGAPNRKNNTTVYIPVVVNDALSWHLPAYAPAIAGMRLLRDGPVTSNPTLAVTRAILRTNPRLSATDALQLASATVQAARENDLPAEFLAATLLQESAFDPRALSSAGAIGIAQFMPSTAQAVGIDPFDPFQAISGAALLLAQYVQRYRSFANPYTMALAAYNAGPGAVEAYRGIPPYDETREYIDDIVDRWAKITGYETPIEPT